MPKLVRRRYIAVEISSDRMFDGRDVREAVLDSVLRLFGEYGASRSEIALIEYAQESKQAIFRCSHEALDLVKASIVAMTEIGGEKATVRIMLISGTLKSLRRKISESPA